MIFTPITNLAELNMLNFFIQYFVKRKCWIYFSFLMFILLLFIVQNKF